MIFKIGSVTVSIERFMLFAAFKALISNVAHEKVGDLKPASFAQ
jgi:hypothetical protein